MNIVMNKRCGIRYSIYIHLFCTNISKIICNDSSSSLDEYYASFDLLSKYLTPIVDSMFILVIVECSVR